MHAVRGLRLVALLGVAAYPAVAGEPVGIDDLDQVVLEKLKLEDFSLASVQVTKANAGGVKATAQVDGEEWTLVLHPHSARDEVFTLQVDDGTGARTIAAPAPATYRGQVIGLPGATVAASIIDGRLHATIFPEDRDAPLLAIEPASRFVEGAAADQHIVYSSDDIGAVGSCGVAGAGQAFRLPAPGDSSQEGIFLRFADIGIDCDFQFYSQEAGSDVSTALSLVEQVINGVRFIYERDVDVSFDITTVVVRTADIVYSGTASGCLESGLLQQLTGEWQTNQSGIPHNLAHLFSGRDFAGGIIGCAWVGEVCDDQPYGVSQTTFSLLTNTGLVAHEIGHNFNATHCDSSPNDCFIMCSLIGGCDGDLTKFGVDAINAIDAWADGGSCFDFLLDVPTAECQLSAFDWALADSADGTGTRNFVDGNCVLALTGGDAGIPGETAWLAEAPVAATISAWYSFTTDDTGAFDSIYYTVDGVVTTIADNSAPGIYIVSFDVEAGNEFGFGVETLDGAFGAIDASVVFFSATAGIAQPSFGWGGGSDSGGSALVTGACIDIIGGDSGVPGLTEINTFACVDGFVTAETNYTSDDTGAFDNAYYNVAGDRTIFADNSDQGDDSLFFSVDPGDLFGFGVETLDGLFGPGVLAVREFRLNAGPQRTSDIPFTFGDNAGGSGSQNDDFSALFITGGDAGIPGETTLAAAVPCADVVVRARVDYTSTDTGAFDSAFYFVGDAVTTIADNASQGIFDIEFLAPRGTAFGFGVETLDGGFGPGVASITNLRMFPVGSEPCEADFNNDGTLNVFDFVGFQGAFTGGRKCADLNADGTLNVFDFVGFQSAFTSGCE